MKQMNLYILKVFIIKLKNGMNKVECLVES